MAQEAQGDDALPAPRNVQTTDVTGAPPPANAPSAPEPSDGSARAPAASIPAAFHGRWGVTPADCTSTAASARGLLLVTGDGLRFRESRAVPAANVGTSANSFSADFAFNGQGKEWTKFETLQLQGEKLVRTESNPVASFTYIRCD